MDEEQDNIRSVDDLDSSFLSTLEYIKSVSTKTGKKSHPVEVKFTKNLAKLNELEPDPEDTIDIPDIILNVQISNPLISKSKVLCSI